MSDPSSEAPACLERIILEAEGHLLNSLLGWGPTSILSDHIKFFQSQAERDPRFSATVNALEDSLVRRREQTSTCYLKFGSDTLSSGVQLDGSVERMGPLFDIDDVLSIFLKRISKASPGLFSVAAADAKKEMNSRVVLDAAAKLSMMKGLFDDALRYFLMIGAHHPRKPWVDMEDEAVAAINTGESLQEASAKLRRNESAYAHVISIIESHHLHQYLLNSEFLFDDGEVPPIFALLRLVGLDVLGDFLIDNCVAPQSNRPSGGKSDKTGGERRGTLPLDLIARQLEGSPKLLHWYLHLVFIRKPSIYVVFPPTSLPPPVITNLHRQHIDLYIRFAGENRDSAKALEGIEAYRVSDKSTPLLAFLKVR